MASYKQPCIHCSFYIESDVRCCPQCGSSSPFGYLCPNCLAPIEKGRMLCSCCNSLLYIECPKCGKPTFVDEKCEHCGTGLMIKCGNPRCGQMQFFQNKKCTACGNKLRNTNLR